METYEFEGKNAEEAIQAASRELNLPVEELDIDIIEPGSAGIFGLVGGRKAKIKVSFTELSKTEEEEIQDLSDIGNLTGLEALEEEKEEGKGGETTTEKDETVTVAKETLEKILSLIPIETTITADQKEGKVTLNIQGDKSGLLIGRKGKTLDALQFITNKIVNKAMEKKANVVVDSESYRKRREDSLIQLALKMGDKAKRIKKPVTTSPMNPHDRRIVHLTLKEDGRLDTRSRGEGLLKKVVIIPKR